MAKMVRDRRAKDRSAQDRPAQDRLARAKKAERTWIVVADGGHARIMESAEAHSGVTVRLEAQSAARVTGGKLASDRLPRAQESANAARHGIEPRLSLKDHEKRLFASRLAGYLKGGAAQYDRLILVAPARFLTLLDQELPAAVARKVAVTRKQDLTWMSEAEVLKRLGTVGSKVQRARVAR